MEREREKGQARGKSRTAKHPPHSLADLGAEGQPAVEENERYCAILDGDFRIEDAWVCEWETQDEAHDCEKKTAHSWWDGRQTNVSLHVED